MHLTKTIFFWKHLCFLVFRCIGVYKPRACVGWACVTESRLQACMWIKCICLEEFPPGHPKMFKKNTRVGGAQWLERRTRDRKVAGVNPCWGGGRIFFSRVNFLCWLLFRYPFHPRVTAAARKRPRSSCQKRRWQVATKHAYTLHMWLCMKWHGEWLYGVHRTCRDWLSLAADSCGTSHASAVSTPLRWIFKNTL